MFNFFGKKEAKKEPPRPAPIDLNIQSQNIANNMANYKLKRDQTDAQLKAALCQFRQAKNPNEKVRLKKKCMQLLKKKKMYENHINNLDNTQMIVDSANMDCQIMKDNMNILQVMQQTVQVQKDTMHAMGGIDKMYDVIDDMNELKEQQQEMNEEFQRNYDVDVGDEELDAELEEIDFQMRVDMDNDGLKAPNEQVRDMKNYDELALEEALK